MARLSVRLGQIYEQENVAATKNMATFHVANPKLGRRNVANVYVKYLRLGNKLSQGSLGYLTEVFNVGQSNAR